MTAQHNRDFYKWSKEQALFLKKGEFAKLDISNIVEEIESLGRAERNALKSHLINLLEHLLKIKYQPQKHTKSWDKSIGNAQVEIQSILQDNPSLKKELGRVLELAYPLAVTKASIQTGLEEAVFPKNCEWPLTKIL